MLKFAKMNTAGVNPDKNRGIHDLGFWQRVLLRVLVGLMRVWASSLRLRVSPESDRNMGALRKRPGLLLLWHNRLFMGPSIIDRYQLSGHATALVSASKDGAWMSAIMGFFDIETVRGSRNRRGREALKELVAARRAGKSIFITPDGSKGPVYVMKPGAALLARETKSEVYLLTVNFSRSWRLRTWDRFHLPIPFTKAEIRVERLDPEAMTTAGNAEAARQILEQGLNALTVDVTP